MTPEQAQVLSQQGLGFLRQEAFNQAEPCFRQIIADFPGLASAYYNLGLSLAGQHRKQEASEAYLKAFELDERLAIALNNLALLCKADKHYAQAQTYFEKAVMAEPTLAIAWLNLGNLYAERRMLEQAIAAFRQATEQNPRLFVAWLKLAEIYQEQGETAKAARCAKAVLLMEPKHEMARVVWYVAARSLKDQSNAGNRLIEWLEELDSSERSRLFADIARKDSKAIPELSEHFQSSGIAWDMQSCLSIGQICITTGMGVQGRYWLDRAREQDPEDAMNHVGCGVAAIVCGEVDVAQSYFDSALRLDPKQPDAAFYVSLLDLMHGKWKSGWKRYETRRNPARMGNQITRDINTNKPRYDGGSLEGKTLLVMREQGLGDTIMYSRFVRNCIERGAHVKLAVFPTQGALIASVDSRVEVIEVAVEEQLASISYDVWTHLLSVPGQLGLTKPVPLASYLKADAILQEAWRTRFCQILGESTFERRLQVGLVWSGGAQHPVNGHRNIDLECFSVLAQVKDVQFHSFMIKPHANDIYEVDSNFWIHDWQDVLTDFSQTAAALTHMDLLITVDTSMAHLGGALGVPTWVLMGDSYYSPLRHIPPESGSDWYSSMKIFNKSPQTSDWDAVFAQVLRSLETIAASFTQRQARVAQSAAVPIS